MGLQIVMGDWEDSGLTCFEIILWIMCYLLKARTKNKQWV